MEICLSALKERMKNQGDPCRHDILIKTLSEYLSATGPCAHEEEAKRLSTDNFCLSRQIITLTEEAKRLREWMGRYRIPRKYGSRPDVFVSQLWEEAELRRQAKEGK